MICLTVFCFIKLLAGIWVTPFDVLGYKGKSVSLDVFLGLGKINSLMLSSGSNLNSSSTSGITSSDMPPLPQCLPLDSITVGNQKYTGELRRVLGVSSGNTSEDHSFGVPHPKSMDPGSSGELKNLKESVQDASRKARYIIVILS
jgi:hypothetical protein